MPEFYLGTCYIQMLISGKTMVGESITWKKFKNIKNINISKHHILTFKKKVCIIILISFIR